MNQQFFKLPSSEIGSNHEGFLTSASVKTHGFYPYEDNGGTSLAIAGEDYCILASDTRQSRGYLIHSRYSPKAFKLSDKAAIALNGYAADGITLVKKLKQKMEWYKHAHDKEMSTPALAQMISITLYMKRFFPYYVSNTLAGLDENGKGVIYRFDPVGSFEPVLCNASGSGESLIQPFLDSQVGFKNQRNVDKVPLPLDKAITIAKDAFTSATERDMYTGDYLEIFVITKDGVEIQSYDLKRD
ncbi:17106_t:CDS:2 [Entrophospora sp. SA101]|nr:5124_t:CDS:2 [Entrophospora sp. SA101]CAJ0759290.1 17106_t:CDS:2 [Entrophospora sp. SA101]CAJ0850648.1 6059_t:CDS:2 [Entrophospora sp. SA101]CAJ0906164.1 6367_t:CDS:2 [Entrophospora sp. SA101]CAJ0914156.1 15810_t:CDS:2 [Entrophospora sp. SA101]